LNYFILGLLPWITILVFAIGMVFRFSVWFRTKQPGALTLFPAPNKGPATFISVLRESLLFPGLFRGDRLLWVSSWIFHITLALIFIGHVRVFMDFPRLWQALGINADTMSAISGGIAGIIIMVCGIALLVRRFVILRVRQISNLPDFLALLLIVAIVVTGNIMRFGAHFDLEITRVYFSNLFTFSLVASDLPAMGMFTLHFLMAQILIMFIPFSKIMHFGGVFFTQTVIQRS